MVTGWCLIVLTSDAVEERDVSLPLHLPPSFPDFWRNFDGEKCCCGAVGGDFVTVVRPFEDWIDGAGACYQNDHSFGLGYF